MRQTCHTLLTLLLALAYCQIAGAQTYVDSAATGANDGTSWADAYTSLHDALDNYSTGDEIWVAAGTYVPQKPLAWAGALKSTFYIYQDVALYGGFNGTETMRSERDPAVNVTILSGDVNGDDILDNFFTNRGDNVINVLYVDTVISNATVIDGFTISGGQADGGSSNIYNTSAGGLWSWGSPQVSQCRFTQNYAVGVAGGMYLRGEGTAEAIIMDCVFEKNQTDGPGGGLTIATFDSSKTVQIHNCQFVENQAATIGGGIAIGSSSAFMTQCGFERNSADAAGGGMYATAFTDEASNYRMILTHCDFLDNTSGEGGGFYYETDAPGDNDLRFDSCTFVNNQASATPANAFPDGGAMEFVYFGGSPSRDSISVTNCLFQGNSAERITGAINIVDVSAGSGNVFNISNSEFIQNSTSIAAGAIFVGLYDNVQNCKVQVTDCEFEENSAQFGGAIHYETNSQGNHLVSFTSCEFNANHAVAGTAGDSTYGGAINVFYFGGAPTNDSLLISDCLFQDNTSETIAGAIAYESEVGSDNVFSIHNSQFVRDSAGREGGAVFINNYNSAADYKFDLVDCLFDGNIAPDGGGMKYISQGLGGNHVNITGTEWVNNQSITNAFGDLGGGGISFLYPLGAFPQNDSVYVSDCLFEGNSSALNTGGISYTHNAGRDNHFEVTDCEFTENEELSGNAVGGLGINEGGISVSVLVQNTRFSENTGPGTAAFGLGVLPTTPGPLEHKIELVNCLFTNHDEDANSSAVLGTNRNFTLTNCTIADNLIPSFKTFERGVIDLQNTIIKAEVFPTLVFFDQQVVPVNSLGGNLTNDTTFTGYLIGTDQPVGTDPLFDMGTYELSQNSPAVDAGIIPLNMAATDLVGNARTQGGCIDIGAIESPHDAGQGCVATNIHAFQPEIPSLLLYPNPVLTTARISIEGMGLYSGLSELNLRVVNTMGQVVQQLSVSTSESELDLDVRTLSPGTYRVVVSDGKAMAVASFVKQ